MRLIRLSFLLCASPLLLYALAYGLLPSCTPETLGEWTGAFAGFCSLAGAGLVWLAVDERWPEWIEKK